MNNTHRSPEPVGLDRRAMTTLVVGIAAVIGLIAVSKDDSPGAQKVSAAAAFPRTPPQRPLSPIHNQPDWPRPRPRRCRALLLTP